MKTQEAFKKELLGFVKSIGEEFPNAGRRIEGSIQNIEKDVMENFSEEVVFRVGSYLHGIMSAESAQNVMTLKELDALIEATDEHIKLHEKDGNQEALRRAQKLKEVLELELRSGRLIESSIDIAKELKNLVGNASILDPDLAIGIYSGYVKMAKGKKPEEIPELAKNLERAETILKIYSLKDKVMKLDREKEAIMKEADPNETLHDLRKIALTKEIVALKTGRLEKNTKIYENVAEKKNTRILLGKMEKMVRIGRKELEWRALEKKIDGYFNAKKKILTIFPI